MENPYHSPRTSEPDPEKPAEAPPAEYIDLVARGKQARQPAISPAGTLLPRHIAAVLDNFLAAIISILVAKQLPEHWSVLPVFVAVFAYLAYYFMFEAALSTTPGKFLMGLKILRYNGEHSTIKQILIRTLFRVVEVNPLLFGALPAALRIIGARDKQRFGDYVADTVVVFR